MLNKYKVSFLFVISASAVLFSACASDMAEENEVIAQEKRKPPKQDIKRPPTNLYFETPCLKTQHQDLWVYIHHNDRPSSARRLGIEVKPFGRDSIEMTEFTNCMLQYNCYEYHGAALESAQINWGNIQRVEAWSYYYECR